MMSTPLTPPHFFVVAVFFLAADALVHLVAARSLHASPDRQRRLLSRSMAITAFLCIVIGLGLYSAKESAWPLQAAPEVMIASVAAALLWRLVRPCSVEWQWEALFYLIAAVLAVWSMAWWNSMQIASTPQSMPQFWPSMSHLALALACGAFIHAGTASLIYLFTDKLSGKTADEEINSNAVLLGLPFLSVSLLLTVIAKLYTRGVYWDWSTAEAWQLLTWLFYVMIWCAWVVLGWRGRRIWGLTALGTVLIVLMLRAI